LGERQKCSKGAGGDGAREGGRVIGVAQRRLFERWRIDGFGELAAARGW